MDPSLVHGGRDAEITDLVSMVAKGLKDHNEEEKAIPEDPAITGEKVALTFNLLINFSER